MPLKTSNILRYDVG